MRTYIHHSLRKSLLLTENVKQAEKLLKQNNIPLDNADYLQLRKEVESHKMIGYMGPLISMSITDTGRFDHSMGSTLLGYLVQNKQFLNLLPKAVHQYSRAPEFIVDISNITKIRNLTKLGNKLTNPNLKKVFKNPGYSVLDDVTDEQFEDVDYFLSKMKSSDQKELLIKSDKYKYFDEFLDVLSGMVEEHKTGFNYDMVMRTINGFDQETIEIKYMSKEKSLILAHIKTYEGSKAVGSKSWCIVGEEEAWNNYTQDAFQYFLFNFNAVESNEKMVGITLDGQNNVTASHDRYDKQFGQPIAYLNKLGIREKVFIINSRARAKIKMGSTLSVAKGEAFLNSDGKERTRTNPITGLFFYEHNSVTYFFNSLNDSDFSKANLDLIFKKFQRVPISVSHYDGGFENGRSTIKKLSDKYINPIELAIFNYDKFPTMIDKLSVSDYDENERNAQRKPTKEKLVQVFSLAYNSHIELQEDTRRSIIHFLKNNGVDILQLAKQAKEKRGENLGNMEVADLIKRGDDIKPGLQNKFGAIRRGEDVSLNTVEINYGIDNGYADIIRKYYEGDIPQYAETQLDYETMQIYKKLGLLDNVTQYIVKKGNIYGVDALNSIEKSLFDHYRA